MYLLETFKLRLLKSLETKETIYMLAQSEVGSIRIKTIIITKKICEAEWKDETGQININLEDN